MKSSDILLSLEFEHLKVSKDCSGRIMVEYANSEIKEGYFLRGDPGRGATFEEACDDYLSKIRGKTIVFNAYSDSRREVRVIG